MRRNKRQRSKTTITTDYHVTRTSVLLLLYAFVTGCNITWQFIIYHRQHKLYRTPLATEVLHRSQNN